MIAAVTSRRVDGVRDKMPTAQRSSRRRPQRREPCGVSLNAGSTLAEAGFKVNARKGIDPIEHPVPRFRGLTPANEGALGDPTRVLSHRSSKTHPSSPDPGRVGAKCGFTQIVAVPMTPDPRGPGVGSRCHSAYYRFKSYHR